MEKHGVGNQVRTASDQVLERDSRKSASEPLYPQTQRESCVFCLFPGLSANCSFSCAVESRASQDEA